MKKFKVIDHPPLCLKVEVSLGYLRPCLKSGGDKLLGGSFFVCVLVSPTLTTDPVHRPQLIDSPPPSANHDQRHPHYIHAL